MAKRILCAIVLIFAFVCVLASCKSTPSCSHDYTEAIYEQPGCTTRGDKKYTCSICGDWYIEYDCIPSTGGHEWKAATCMSYAVCKICGWEDYITGYAPHDYNEATCDTLATCKFCETETGYYASHQYSETDGACTACHGGVTFIVPQTPIEIAYKTGSTIKQKCKIESIKIKRNQEYYTHKYEITFIVESTYHEQGALYSAKACFGWKLYDEDGLVVTSGTGYTDATIALGEKSKEVITFYVDDDSDDVQDGKTYRLELLNIG